MMVSDSKWTVINKERDKEQTAVWNGVRKISGAEATGTYFT